MHLDPYAVNDLLILSTTAFIQYELVDGSIQRAVILPGLGYALYKAGNFFQFEKVASIGQNILRGSIIAVPSGVVAYGVSSVLERTNFGKIMAMILGCVMASKDFAIYKAARERIIQM